MPAALKSEARRAKERLGFSPCFLPRRLTSRQQRPRDQPEAADQQDQHHQRMEQRRRLKIDVQIREHPGDDEQRSGRR